MLLGCVDHQTMPCDQSEVLVLDKVASMDDIIPLDNNMQSTMGRKRR